MSTQAERVLALLKARGLTDRQIKPQLSKVCGVAYQSAQQWLNGDTKSIAGEYLAKIARHWGANLAWLVDGSGQMDAGGDLPAVRGPHPIVVSDDVTIPQFDTGGMGGHGLILQDQPGIIENWQVSREWAKANIPSSTGFHNLCIVTGFGDSMPDAFNPGDPVIVDMGIRTCTHDGIYFFRVGNEGFIKILQRIPGVGIMAISQNKNYRDWAIRDDMDFQVFGKVLKAWKGKNY